MTFLYKLGSKDSDDSHWVVLRWSFVSYLYKRLLKYTLIEL